MCKICVFAGTTEGRELVEFLTSQGGQVTACVATQYGETLLQERENLTISSHRLTEPEMENMFRREKFQLVVDATHPYAPVVTENIAAACKAAGTEYLRLLRSEQDGPMEAFFADSIREAAEYLSSQEGNILLTTGSKELSQYRGIRDFENRVYARVLPMEDSLALCRQAGVQPSHIIAMQGPFSLQMNVAMLRSVSAAFLVTKSSGKPGGFEEKVQAASDAGARLVVIGRPPQRSGSDYEETVRLLCQRFGFHPRPVVTVVGIGPGSEKFMTEEVREAVSQADCLIGAQRMTEAVAHSHQRVVKAISAPDIASAIHSMPQCRRFAVVMSGDTGFFSGTKKLLPLLDQCDVRVLPGISSLSCLCARLGTAYDDVKPVSLHGRNHDLVLDVRRNPRIFTLVGGENGLGKLCAHLTEAGLGRVRVSAGENLSYPNEKITTGRAEDLKDRIFAPLSVALIENDSPDFPVTQGLPDEAFVRCDSVPMTKSEVRAVCLSKLRLTRDSVCWDVGAGTGSVSVEMALQAEAGQVYAIERKEDAVNLLHENAGRFALSNLEVIPGSAPDACRELPAPTHVFIGGSSGNMEEILSLILEKNSGARIVATAIALESVSELTRCIKTLPFARAEVISMTVARDRKAGPYHLMTGQNPIYIFTMEGKSS